MTRAAIRARKTGISFAVRLTPKGGRDAIEGWAEGADGNPHLKIRVSAAPHEGQANEALIALLARSFGVAKSKVQIVSGVSARIKLIDIEGDGQVLAARLAQWEKNA